MKRCPKCHRFGIEYDYYRNIDKCLWNDCLWENTEGIDIDKAKHPEVDTSWFIDSALSGGKE